VTLKRTEWAERFIEKFASLPLVSEWVFRSPRRIDRGIEKEVCDLLVSLRGDALLLQMKCKEDPNSLTESKRISWVLKRTGEAANQMKGAIRSVKTTDLWCNHPRKGEVLFDRGDLTRIHGIVLVENWGDRVVLPSAFPLHHDGIAISYFSVNDFQNVINELRAFPDISEYLNSRRSLPEDTLRAIGGEEILFLYYLLHNHSFEGWTNFDDAEREAGRVSDRRAVVFAARTGQEGALLLERVADDLSGRTVDSSRDLPPDLIQGYVPPYQRIHYLCMKENICDLRLPARKLMGLKLSEAIGDLGANLSQDMKFSAAYVDYKPDFLYVLAAAKGFDRATLLKSGCYALWCGLAHYRKEEGLYIADRDGQGFEVVYLSGICEDPEVFDSPEARLAGEKMFGELKIYHC